MWLRACLPSPGGGGSPPRAPGWGDEVPKTRSIDQFKRKTARRLRKNSTDAELRLWRYLRRLEIRGTHFRRQMPIGNFVVDFACPAAHLIVEVDGSQHGEADVSEQDGLKARGIGPSLLEQRRHAQYRQRDGSDLCRASWLSRGAGSQVEAHTPSTRFRRQGVHPTPARCARRPSPSRGGSRELLTSTKARPLTLDTHSSRKESP
jgi:hypothetical protein